MNTFEIALRTNQLPEKIEELVPMMFAGNAAVKFIDEKLKLIDYETTKNPSDLLEEQRKQTIKDGQAMGEMLIKIMDRIGELSYQAERRKETKPRRKSRKDVSQKEISKELNDGAREKAKLFGLKSRQQLHAARVIHKNPDVVAHTVKKAKELDDIPNVTMVVKEVKHKKDMAKMKERAERAENNKSEFRLGLEEQQYISALELALMKIPRKTPVKWTEQGLEKATAIVLQINKRLQHFNEVINNKRLK